MGSAQGRGKPTETRGSLRGGTPATGAEAEGFMKRRTRYRDEPLGRLEIVGDFLPPPEKLVLRDDGVKVTISLSKHSVDFIQASRSAFEGLVSEDDSQFAGWIRQTSRDRVIAAPNLSSYCGHPPRTAVGQHRKYRTASRSRSLILPQASRNSPVASDNAHSSDPTWFRR